MLKMSVSALALMMMAGVSFAGGIGEPDAEPGDVTVTMTTADDGGDASVIDGGSDVDPVQGEDVRQDETAALPDDGTDITIMTMTGAGSPLVQRDVTKPQMGGGGTEAPAAAVKLMNSCEAAIGEPLSPLCGSHKRK